MLRTCFDDMLFITVCCLYCTYLICDVDATVAVVVAVGQYQLACKGFLVSIRRLAVICLCAHTDNR